jgi:Na+/H+ antiporter NhaD/arsenite permease-like protein
VDRLVSVGALEIGALWTGTLVLLALGFLQQQPLLGDVAVVSAIGAALLTVRSWLNALANREREIFELGQQSVRPMPRR